MTPEEAYTLARYQRPGVRLIVGPTAAREDHITPLNPHVLSRLPGHPSWVDYDVVGQHWLAAVRAQQEQQERTK